MKEGLGGKLHSKHVKITGAVHMYIRKMILLVRHHFIDQIRSIQPIGVYVQRLNTEIVKVYFTSREGILNTHALRNLIEIYKLNSVI